MKIGATLAVTLAFALAAGAQRTGGGLEGCGSVDALAKALAILEKDPLTDTSWDHIRAYWPTKLEAGDCTPEDCRLMMHQGRVIDNQIQCGETIDIERKSASATTIESLVGAIYYSARSREEAVAAAKHLTKAAGLGDRDVATIGLRSTQSFQWDVQKKEGFSVDVTLIHIQNIWKTSVRVDRHVLHFASPN